MNFYIIYSFDCKDSVGYYYPRKSIMKKATITEVGKPDWVEDYDKDDENTIGWKHRQLTAELSLDEFIEFMDDTCLSFKAETMGSLTLEYGWMPALSFGADDGVSYINCHVTPIPDLDLKMEYTEDEMNSDWERVSDILKECSGGICHIDFEEAIIEYEESIIKRDNEKYLWKDQKIIFPECKPTFI